MFKNTISFSQSIKKEWVTVIEKEKKKSESPNLLFNRFFQTHRFNHKWIKWVIWIIHSANLFKYTDSLMNKLSHFLYKWVTWIVHSANLVINTDSLRKETCECLYGLKNHSITIHHTSMCSILWSHSTWLCFGFVWNYFW